MRTKECSFIWYLLTQKVVRHTANFAAMLFVVWSGCNVTKTPSTHDVSQSQPASAYQQSSDRLGRKYEDGVSGRAETTDGIVFSFHSYKSSDGVPISTRVERHGSHARAKRELLEHIRAAIKVLDREPKLDDNGKYVGDRAVLSSKQKESGKLQTTVLWTDDSQLYFIESPSLQHALEFEKWYLRNP